MSHIDPPQKVSDFSIQESVTENFFSQKKSSNFGQLGAIILQLELFG